MRWLIIHWWLQWPGSAAQLGGTGVPLFINGKQKMSGFSESRFKQWYAR